MTSAGVKAQCYVSGGRILLDDNTGGGNVMFAADSVALCWSLGFSRSRMCIHVHLTVFIVLEFGFQPVAHAYTCAFDNIYCVGVCVSAGRPCVYMCI